MDANLQIRKAFLEEGVGCDVVGMAVGVDDEFRR
jgi:hypothetical protein